MKYIKWILTIIVIFIILSFVIGLIQSSVREARFANPPRVVEVTGTYPGQDGKKYTLLTDQPVPEDPELAKDIDFRYVGEVVEGTRCIVLGVAQGWYELFYEVACQGLQEVGFIPAEYTRAIEY